MAPGVSAFARVETAFPLPALGEEAAQEGGPAGAGGKDGEQLRHASSLAVLSRSGAARALKAAAKEGQVLFGVQRASPGSSLLLRLLAALQPRPSLTLAGKSLSSPIVTR